MLLVALIYLLLAMEVTVRARLCLDGARGSVQLEAGAMGVFFHMDGELSLGPGRPRMTRRYAAQRARKCQGRAISLRTARPYLLAAIRAGRVERARLFIRLGLEDAAQTAMAAGALRALALALFAGLGLRSEALVEPEFRAPCFLMAAQGIFSARPGDIMFAMIRVLVRRIRLAARRRAGRAAGRSPAGTQG
ncbi:MAG: hypothetical protein ACI4PG_10430 [Candidatus Ventricola sp.]